MSYSRDRKIPALIRGKGGFEAIKRVNQKAQIQPFEL
jgi:hypothetical protein